MSLPLILLAMIPILFPLVLIFGLIILLLAYIFYRSLPALPKSAGDVMKDLNIEITNFHRGPAILSSIATKITMYSIIVNGTLYVLLLAHSWLFYINPLSNDLEPVRNIFRENPDSLIKSEK